MRTAEFLKINPAGKVPTLLIDGRPLTEVAGILFYLAKRFPEAGLLPHDDIEAEAQAMSWMSFHRLDPASGAPAGPRPCARRSIASPTSGSATAGRSAHVIRSPTFICSGSIGGCSTRCIRHRATFPNLDAHYARMMARPAVRRTIEAETAVGYELPA